MAERPFVLSRCVECNYIMKDKNIYRVQKGENYSLYTKNGAKHNLNGPALVIGEDEHFYVEGKKYTQTQWTDYVSAYTAYEKSPSLEKDCFMKAIDSPDGIYVEVK